MLFKLTNCLQINFHSSSTIVSIAFLPVGFVSAKFDAAAIRVARVRLARGTAREMPRVRSAKNWHGPEKLPRVRSAENWFASPWVRLAEIGWGCAFADNGELRRHLSRK
jgi:hypothetical protein